MAKTTAYPDGASTPTPSTAAVDGRNPDAVARPLDRDVDVTVAAITITWMQTSVPIEGPITVTGTYRRRLSGNEDGVRGQFRDHKAPRASARPPQVLRRML
jgi:hypothetical protein